MASKGKSEAGLRHELENSDRFKISRIKFPERRSPSFQRVGAPRLDSLSDVLIFPVVSSVFQLIGVMDAV